MDQNTNSQSYMDLHIQQHHEMLYRQMQLMLYHNQSQQLPPANNWPATNLLGGSTLPNEVVMSLQNKKLWDYFYPHTTEMIITKCGRRMYPSLQVSINGLEKETYYCIVLEMTATSSLRYKYSGNKRNDKNSPTMKGWVTTGPSDCQIGYQNKIYVHPDSPANGEHWMQRPIDFGKLKLTNNQTDPKNHILLNSMHKYVPRIWVIHCKDSTPHNSVNLYMQPSKSFVFAETEFIAVTAYQNEVITKLKIDNNPFAKGFRETGHSKSRKRKTNSITQESNSMEYFEFQCSDQDIVTEVPSVSDTENHSIEMSTKVCKTSVNDRRHFGELLSDPLTESTETKENEEHDSNTNFHRPWLIKRTSFRESPNSTPLRLRPLERINQHFPLTYPVISNPCSYLYPMNSPYYYSSYNFIQNR